LAEEKLNRNGVIHYCQHMVNTVCWNPTSPQDVSILLKELQYRNINHQIDFDQESGEYIAYIWINKDNHQLEKEPLIEYSCQDKDIFYAISTAVAKMVRYTIED